MEPVRRRAAIRPETEGSPVTVVSMKREIAMLSVTMEEFEMISSPSTSINMPMFTLCLGSLISVAATIATVQLTDRHLAVFSAVCLVLVLATVYFGIRAVSEYRHGQRLRQHILDQHRGTVMETKIQERTTFVVK